MVEITLSSGKKIEATAEHPFYIKGKGWNPAASLKVGQVLVLHNGTTVVVEEVDSRVRQVRVFNFSVANAHSYFVGGDGVLVHNAQNGPSAKGRAMQRAHKLKKQLSKNKLPTTTSAAVNRKTGFVYYGYSGDKPNIIHPALRRRMPENSLEKWPVNNCAEFSACNKALLKGACFNDLEVYTVLTEEVKPYRRCKNCRITTAGVKTKSEKNYYYKR